MHADKRTRVLILGAAGRDFHDFNTVFRDDPEYEVVAFTHAQIAGVGDRRYPAALAGPLYPDGIAIRDETELESICRQYRVSLVVFAYSDISHEHVMHLASRALALGADFLLLGPEQTMLASPKPVIAVSAVRTGCGKSQVARWLSTRLRAAGLRTGIIRHPMPYGDLEAQAVQRFATRGDLTAGRCTIEEREEYEPHLAAGGIVYAGVDYRRITVLAADESDVLVWDGGNNDFPFLRPDLHIVLVDPLRPGHETGFHPGEAVLRMADVVVIAKADVATAAAVGRVRDTVREINPRARIVSGASPVRLDDEDAVKGRRVLVVEDGPTITHGGMPFGAGYLAAQRAGAAEIIDPRSCVVEPLAAIYRKYPHIGRVLPAMGYDADQVAALAETVARAPVDAVIAATPIDLSALIQCTKPVVRARYEFAEAESPGLGEIIDGFLEKIRPDRAAGLSR